MQLALLRAPFFRESFGVALEGLATLHHLDAGGDVGRRLHIHSEAETVEQLGAQLALFRIAAADQHEAGGMAHAQALALDDILAGGRHIQQQVHEMVLQQIGLVDIEEAPVGAGQQARLEGLFAHGQGAFEIQRAHHPVLGRAERQIDHGDGGGSGLQFALGVEALAGLAQALGLAGIAVVDAA